MSDKEALLIEYVKSGGRVCPVADCWHELWEMLAEQARSTEHFDFYPSLPLILSGAALSTLGQKRARLIQHIKYAAQHGALEKIDQFLRGLLSEQWVLYDRPETADPDLWFLKRSLEAREADEAYKKFINLPPEEALEHVNDLLKENRGNKEGLLFLKLDKLTLFMLEELENNPLEIKEGEGKNNQYREQCRSALGHILELWPNNGEAILRKVWFLLVTKEYEACLTYIEKLNWDIFDSEEIERLNDMKKDCLDKLDSSNHTQHGFKLLNEGSLDEAIIAFAKAIEADPKNANAFCKRGLAYVKKKDNDSAMADFTKALELDPKDDNSYKMRGHIYLEIKDYDHAITDLARVLELNPNDDYSRKSCVYAYLTRANYYYEKKFYDKAIVDNTKAINLNPNDFTGYYNRGLANYAKGDYPSAIVDFSDTLKIKPDDASARKYLELATTNAKKCIYCNRYIKLNYCQHCLLMQPISPEERIRHFKEFMGTFMARFQMRWIPWVKITTEIVGEDFIVGFDLIDPKSGKKWHGATFTNKIQYIRKIRFYIDSEFRHEHKPSLPFVRWYPQFEMRFYLNKYNAGSSDYVDTVDGIRVMRWGNTGMKQPSFVHTENKKHRYNDFELFDLHSSSPFGGRGFSESQWWTYQYFGPGDHSDSNFPFSSFSERDSDGIGSFFVADYWDEFDRPFKPVRT